MNCGVCGCSDNAPCFIGALAVFRSEEVDRLSEQQLEEMNLTPCSWVQPGLCSACLDSPPPPLLFDGDGKPLRGAP